MSWIIFGVVVYMIGACATWKVMRELGYGYWMLAATLLWPIFWLWVWFDEFF